MLQNEENMEKKKKISVMIPCYNEVENVEPMSYAVVNVLEEALSRYDYEILFIDNCSTDGTRDKLEKICAENKKIKAIFNVTNFGQFNSPFHGLCQTTGDCTISMCCDFQDPVELIPRFVEEWEIEVSKLEGSRTTQGDPQSQLIWDHEAQRIYNSSFRGSETFFWPQWACCTQTHGQNTHIHKIKTRVYSDTNYTQG